MLKWIKSNWAYFIWGAFYVLLAWIMFVAVVGNPITGFLITIGVYAVSMTIALSPIGEALLRAIEGVRPLSTREEIEYLQPIFEEVYAKAKEKNKRLNDNIKLHIIDAMYINAFAIGRKTIAVTIGAIETFSPEELKGIIAHEFGHIANGDTKALLINVIGNGIFSIFVLIIRAITFIANVIVSGFDNLWAKILMFIFNFGLNINLLLLTYIGQIILSINSRTQEYMADKFAYDIRYGESLVSSLYILQKISLPQGLKLADKIRASHPHTAKRIGRLEKLLSEDNGIYGIAQPEM